MAGRLTGRVQLHPPPVTAGVAGRSEVAGLGAGLALLATSPETFPEVQPPELLRETRALPLRTPHRASPKAGQPPHTPQREAGQPPHPRAEGGRPGAERGSPACPLSPASPLSPLSPAAGPPRTAGPPAAPRGRAAPAPSPFSPSAPQVGSRLTCGVPPGGAADEEPGEAAGGQPGSRRPPHAPAERPR